MTTDSLVTTWRLTLMGRMMAAAPRMSRRLAMLLPTTLPTLMPGSPLRDAMELAPSSGRDVP